jgi:hypothetical protein
MHEKTVRNKWGAPLLSIIWSAACQFVLTFAVSLPIQAFGMFSAMAVLAPVASASLRCSEVFSGKSKIIDYATQDGALALYSTFPQDLFQSHHRPERNQLIFKENSGINQRLLDLYADYRVGYEINNFLSGQAIDKFSIKLAPDLVSYVLNRPLLRGDESIILTVYNVLKELHLAFDKVAPLDVGTVLFRGTSVRLDQFEDVKSQKTTGKRITSTTFDSRTAGDFAGLRNGGMPGMVTVIYRYTVKGSSVKGLEIHSVGRNERSLNEIAIKPDTVQEIREIHHFKTTNKDSVILIVADLH